MVLLPRHSIPKQLQKVIESDEMSFDANPRFRQHRLMVFQEIAHPMQLRIDWHPRWCKRLDAGLDPINQSPKDRSDDKLVCAHHSKLLGVGDSREDVGVSEATFSIPLSSNNRLGAATESVDVPRRNGNRCQTTRCQLPVTFRFLFELR